MAAGQLGGGTFFIDEDEPLGIEVKLAVEACLSPDQGVTGIRRHGARVLTPNMVCVMTLP